MNARELLVSICQEVGFPAPAPSSGLAEWADETLDVALGPRGSDRWQRGHEHTIAALEAALEGARGIVKAELQLAVSLVQREGRQSCSCRVSERGLGMTATNGRMYCVKCGGRQ